MILASIIIPVFGPEILLTNCLRALETNTDTTGANLWEVICVDNGTGYDIKSDAIIRNPDNRGYGVASNEGASIAHGEILIMLNVDTEVQPGWLPPLLATFDDPEVAMCGPRIIHPDGTLQTASGIRTWHGNGSAGGEELKIDGPSCDADGVTGACMAVRKSVFNAMGGFDTRFINGYEDVALCLSLREAGWRIRFIAESTIVHHESASGPERWAHCAQNVATMNTIWGNR